MVAAIKVGNRAIAGITHMHMDYAYPYMNPASSNLLRSCKTKNAEEARRQHVRRCA